jgi:hypothetical protein
MQVIMWTTIGLLFGALVEHSGLTRVGAGRAAVKSV